MVTIEKIKLKDLNRFITSDLYLNFENKPISVLRANSYINNPNGDKDDVVLYMAFLEDELVGYRTLFSDVFYSLNNSIKFGWLSGTWTHEKYRRKGVSLKLLEQAYNDWNGMLIITNYIEQSKAVYDKSGKFELLKTLQGNRYYLRFCLKELLPPKLKLFQNNSKILSYIDCLLNGVFDFRFKLNTYTDSNLYSINEIEELDSEIVHFLEPFKDKELFQRNSDSYNWIFKYPWIKTDDTTKQESENYYFSSFSNRFESKIFKIVGRDSAKLLGIFIININENKISLPYSYMHSECFSSVSLFLIKFCQVHKINYCTVYDKELNKELESYKNFKIASKKFTQNYFVSKKLLQKYPEIKNGDIQSGDGDVVFT